MAQELLNEIIGKINSDVQSQSGCENSLFGLSPKEFSIENDEVIFNFSFKFVVTRDAKKNVYKITEKDSRYSEWNFLHEVAFYVLEKGPKFVFTKIRAEEVMEKLLSKYESIGCSVKVEKAVIKDSYVVFFSWGEIKKYVGTMLGEPGEFITTSVKPTTKNKMYIDNIYLSRLMKNHGIIICAHRLVDQL